MNRNNVISQSSLFVYIPCHEDFADALKQANFLEKENEFLRNDQIKLKICISYNGEHAEKYKSTYQNSEHREYIFSYQLTGDINISLGLLKSTFIGYDYVWILSANDELNEGFLAEIIKPFGNQNNSNLIVFGESSGIVSINEDDVLAHKSPYKLGLISSVIYNRKTFQTSFNQGIKYENTGWAQLAVILNATKGENQLRAWIIPSNLVFKTSKNLPKNLNDYLVNFNKYFHSFYGLPVLIYMLREKKIARKYFVNWYFKHIKYFYFYQYIENKLENETKTNKYIFDSLVLKNHLSIRIIHFILIENIFAKTTVRIILNLAMKKVTT